MRLLAPALILGLIAPVSAQACELLDGDDLLEKIMIEYYTSNEEDDDFYALFIPARRVISINGVQRSFSVTQILELNKDYIPQNTQHVVTAEFIDNYASNALPTEVTILAFEVGFSTYIVANQCGEVQRIVR